MNRRRVLAGLAGAASAALAGCSGGSEDDGTGTDPASPTADGPTRLTDRSFERTSDCDAAEEGFAGVTYGNSVVRCEGCIAGADGCTEAVLGSAEYDAGEDVLSVVVTTESEAGAETGCTQQIVHRSYEARLTFAGGVPGETVVYHESMGDREEATRASSN